MKRNEKPMSEPIEKLLAAVQLRRPELDVETLLAKAGEQSEDVARRERCADRLYRQGSKRCFCRWLKLTGLWTSGLAVGVLITYLYTSNTLQAARAELQHTRSQLASQTVRQTPVEKTLPAETPERLCDPVESAWESDRRLQASRFLEEFDRPGRFDEDIQLCAMSSVGLRKIGKNTTPRVSGTPDVEVESPKSVPYQPTHQKTQQELFQEILDDLKV